MAKKFGDGIELTQCGQVRPYADTVHAGTVEAADEADARSKLAAMRSVNVILDHQDKERWSTPYFSLFRQVEPGKWAFRIVEEYTG